MLFPVNLIKGEISELLAFDMIIAVSSTNSWSTFFPGIIELKTLKS